MRRPTDTTQPPEREMSPVTPTRSARRAVVMTAAALSLVAGVVAGVASAGDQDARKAAPAGVAPVLADPAAGGSITVLDTPATTTDPFAVPGRPLEPEVLAYLDSIAVLDRARLAEERDGLRVWIAPAREAGAICIIAAGTTDDAFAANCPPVRVALAGQAVLGVRGGPGSAWTFVGIAPNAVATVSDGQRRVAAGRNAFVLTRRGSAPASLRYRLRDGRERHVPAPGVARDDDGDD